MSWAKFDDRYDDNRKVKRAWRAHPRAVGLHAMAVTYCARHETDGVVDIEWITDKLPSRVDREKCLVALLSAGLFERIDDDHFQVHDYLEYNDSHAVLGERRARDAERKARGRAQQSTRSPRGRGGDVQAESDGPDPTRPDPTLNGTSVPDERTTSGSEDKEDVAGKLDAARQRLRDDELTAWLGDYSAVTGHTPPRDGTKARAALASSFNARREEDYTLDDLKLATRGAHADDYRREHGYDTAESILRPTKIHDLVEKGQKATNAERQPTGAELAARTAQRDERIRRQAALAAGGRQ